MARRLHESTGQYPGRIYNNQRSTFNEQGDRRSYFRNHQGCSWIDLTLCNDMLAQNTRRWTCREEEISSDHKLILFDIEAGTSDCNVFNHAGTRYQIKTEDWGKFENKLVSNFLSRFNCVKNSRDLIKCNESNPSIQMNLCRSLLPF